MKSRSVVSAVAAIGCAALAFGWTQLPKPASRPWTPPTTKLPKELVTEIDFMQEHGFGDTRDGVYSEAEVERGDLWNPEATSKMKGWLVPGERRGKRQLIGLSGVAYDIVQVIGPANLAADLKAAKDHFKKSVYGNVTTGPTLTDLTGVALLLISGQVKFAEQAYDSPRPLLGFRGGRLSGDGHAPEPDQLPVDPMGALAHTYLFAKWDKCVTAHMRGDDQEAADETQEIVDTWEAIDAAVRKEMGDRWSKVTSSGGPRQIFTHLNVAKTLLEDSRRRLKEGKKEIDLDAIKKLDISARIKALIDALDQVAARQDGQPGSIVFIQDPIIAALVEIGSPAVDSLFAAMETDKRLTRSVSFPRDFKVTRNLVTVADAARATVLQISQNFNLQHKPISEMKAYWQQYGAFTPTERQLEALKNDHDPSGWYDAARFLVEPNDRVRTSDSSWTEPGRRDGMLKASFRGEPLRAQSNPTVSELLSRRIREYAESWDENGGSAFVLGRALQMVQMLDTWEPGAALAAAQVATREAMSTKPYNVQQWAHFANAIRIRKDAGDKVVIDEYSDWIKSDPFESLDNQVSPAFEPLIRYASDPRIASAADHFGKYMLSQRKELANSGQIRAVVTTPLLGIRSFRSAVLEMLRDKTKIGQVWVEGHTVWTSQPHGKSGQTIDPKKGEKLPPATTKLSHRTCDALAVILARNQKDVLFEAYWPTEKRDAAIREIIQQLNAGTYPVGKWDPWMRDVLKAYPEKRIQ